MMNLSAELEFHFDLILWVGPSSELASAVMSKLSFWKNPIAMEMVTSFESCRLLNFDRFGVVLFDLRNATHLRWQTELSQLRHRSLDLPFIVLFDEKTEAGLLTAVNEIGIFAAFDGTSAVQDLSLELAAACHSRGKARSTSSYLSALKIQNQKLEGINHQLSCSLASKDEEWKKSKSKSDLKKTEMRRLIRFVKNLAGLVAIEELIEVLKQETKQFHQVQDPVLVCSFPDGSCTLFFIQGGKIKIRSIQNFLVDDLKPRINEKSDSLYLANLCSRPFGPVLAIPIASVEEGEKSNEPRTKAVVFFENSLAGSDLETFLKFISQRMQAVSIALDRIVLEQDLRKTSRLWEESFDCIEEPIAIMDVNFNVLRANRTFFRQGNAASCHLGFNGSDDKCTGCPLPEALEKSQPVISQVRREGRLFEVHSYPICLMERESTPTVVNYYLDVTKSQELQSRVAQVEKMDAVGYLAGHIAHELNNPLAGIRATAQILLHDRKERDCLYNDLVEVEKAASRCQAIIFNLLEFSRDRSDRSDSSIYLISLNDMIEKTLPLLKTAMIPFFREIDLTSESTNVRAEPQLLQQVIFNIVNNACQAMGDEGTLTILTHHTMVDGLDYIDLLVRDSGKGIPVDIQHSIFNPFFTTKEAGQGTGLGLSISQRVVEGFGGKIFLNKSNSEEGTEFVIRLPFAGDSQ
jgi:two-component system NtrC family sensor kinase